MRLTQPYVAGPEAFEAVSLPSGHFEHDSEQTIRKLLLSDGTAMLWIHVGPC